MEYKKITAEDIAGKGVVGQADTPLLSALEMQNKVEEVPRAVIIPHFNSLIDSLEKRDADVDTALSDRYTKTETDKAIGDKLTEIGAGDMQKAVYDTDGDGVVDNAAKLGGKLPGDYMPAKNIAYNAETIDSLTTFAMRNTTNTATDSLSVACKAAYGTALWFMFSIAQADSCVQYAFPYGTKNGFLMRNYNWWTKSWSNWESVVPASGGTVDELTTQWTITDGSVIRLRKMGTASAYNVGFVVAKPDGTTEYYPLFESTGSGVAVRLVRTTGATFTGAVYAAHHGGNVTGVRNMKFYTAEGGHVTDNINIIKVYDK